MPGIAAKLLFGFILTLAAIFVLLILAGLIAGLLAPFLGSVPISYNFRSIRARWTSTIVAVLGIAGTVGVFVAMLSLANGFKATLVASGSPGNALILRAGSPTEMMGGVTLDSVRVVQDAPGVARDSSGPLVTQEVVGVMPFPLNLHRHRRQCAGPRRLLQRPARADVRKNYGRANVPARPFRNRGRQKCFQNLHWPYSREYGSVRRRPLAGGRHL